MSFYNLFAKHVFFPFFSFLVISVTVISCTPRDDRGGGHRENITRLREGERDHSKTNCSQRDSYSEEVRFKSLDFLDSNNAGKYILEGHCEERDKLVYVWANGLPADKNPICDRGRWRVTLDLSTEAPGEDFIVFYVTHNRASLCTEVRVGYQAPINYISIASNEDHYETSFYVMKYEAKLDGEGSNARAVSEPEGKPLSRVSYEEALKLCKNVGSRVDLIQNAQWQNIALSIEEMDENWSTGRAVPEDSNVLNCGVTRGSPLEALSECFGKSCDPDWDVNKRTHVLPGSKGEEIWDICGNVGEMMRDRYRADENVRKYIYQLSSDLKDRFGPKRNYSVANANRRGNTWNLGYAEIRRGKDLVVRGSPGNNAGIFSVDVTSDQDGRSRGNIGFRCVYIP